MKRWGWVFVMAGLWGCESADSAVYFAQCETLRAVVVEYCLECTTLDSQQCDGLGDGVIGGDCYGKKPQEGALETNFFADCIQPAADYTCDPGGYSLPSACSLAYDEDLAEKQQDLEAER